MKISSMLLNAVMGWAAGLVTALVLSVLKPNIIPIVDRAGALEGSWKILLIILTVVSPFSLVGGIVGGRLAREGGRREQIQNAILFGIIFTVPFACFGLWYIGW